MVSCKTYALRPQELVLPKLTMSKKEIPFEYTAFIQVSVKFFCTKISLKILAATYTQIHEVHSMHYKNFLRYFPAIAFYAITFLMIDRVSYRLVTRVMLHCIICTASRCHYVSA